MSDQSNLGYPKNISVDKIDPNLPPDQFLYGRKGPWPQPSPAHPLKEAAEVLNIPLAESLIFDATIGRRLVEEQIGYAGLASVGAAADLTLPIPTDDEFNTYMLGTCYTRYLQPASTSDITCNKNSGAVKYWKYDFSAMVLVKPLEGLYCAPVVCFFEEDTNKKRRCVEIKFRADKPDRQDVSVCPGDNAWGLGKIYALQGAAYHMLFVVHPTLHMPMDSVIAITKTTLPHIHPLFQLLYPHTGYTLALDNAVLEGSYSVVNDNAQGTWFDPLTGDAYNLKLLFAAGYTGLKDWNGHKNWFGTSYPPYDYTKPQMGFDSAYGAWLSDYYDVFTGFSYVIAETALKADSDPDASYLKRWARYNNTYVLGFPDENAIIDQDCLTQTLATFMWDLTVSHGGDHYSFTQNIPARHKFLRIRNYAPPTSKDAKSPAILQDVATGDDLYRMQLAHQSIFKPHAMKPNLDETMYLFTNPALQATVAAFKGLLWAVSDDYKYSTVTPFQPLTEKQAKSFGADYSLTIPASIQY
jgi:hypothetical protein